MLAEVMEAGDDGFEDVLLAARHGAEWAWKRIYDEYAPKIVGYLRAHGAADPEDVTGEVFLQVVRNLSKFSGGRGDFSAWTFTIAHRRLIDEFRRRGQRPIEAALPEVVERAAGVAGNVHDDAEARIAHAAVRDAIDDLPVDQRSVVLLRIIGDLTIEEIARAVGKQPGAVKALQRRGLRRLERAYPFEHLQR